MANEFGEAPRKIVSAEALLDDKCANGCEKVWQCPLGKSSRLSGE